MCCDAGRNRGNTVRNLIKVELRCQAVRTVLSCAGDWGWAASCFPQLEAAVKNSLASGVARSNLGVSIGHRYHRMNRKTYYASLYWYGFSMLYLQCGGTGSGHRSSWADILKGGQSFKCYRGPTWSLRVVEVSSMTAVRKALQR